jgi:hypothetical protein
MKKIVTGLLVAIFLFLAKYSFVFAEGKPATELNKKVHTEGLTGINYFLANTYNTNRLLFAVVSTGSVVVLGLIVTYIVGLIIKPHASTEKHE